MIATIAFYLFAAILLFSAGMVVSARNPVHSVLFLILAFFNAAALFLIAGAEFLAMILVIVYVGAVAVLFLFVVMMLDVNFVELRGGFQRYCRSAQRSAPCCSSSWSWCSAAGRSRRRPASCASRPSPPTSTTRAALGRLIYTDYVLLFQTAGLVLMVAMIGAIVLTLPRTQDLAAPVGARAGRAGTCATRWRWSRCRSASASASSIGRRCRNRRPCSPTSR